MGMFMPGVVWTVAMMAALVLMLVVGVIMVVVVVMPCCAHGDAASMAMPALAHGAATSIGIVVSASSMRMAVPDDGVTGIVVVRPLPLIVVMMIRKVKLVIVAVLRVGLIVGLRARLLLMTAQGVILRMAFHGRSS